MKKISVNRLEQLHKFLKEANNDRCHSCMETACSDLNISQSSFYKRLKSPAQSFSKAEKEALAKIYELPVHFLFPELEAA